MCINEVIIVAYILFVCEETVSNMYSTFPRYAIFTEGDRQQELCGETKSPLATMWH